MGNVVENFASDQGEFSITLKEVLLVPKLDVNLISVSVVLQNGYAVVFRENMCSIFRESDGSCAFALSRTRRADGVRFVTKSTEHANQDGRPISKRLCNARLGRPSCKVVEILAK